MQEFLKLKKELVNGRHRNIYTKKNGTRQYVKFDGNYVLLSTFNKPFKNPSKKSRATRSTPQRVFHGGGYTYTDLCIMPYTIKFECFKCPLKGNVITTYNMYMLHGKVYDINNLYIEIFSSKKSLIVLTPIEMFDIYVNYHKNESENWSRFYFIYTNKLKSWNIFKNKFRNNMMHKIRVSNCYINYLI
jgi:hypothetical protein